MPLAKQNDLRESIVDYVRLYEQPELDEEGRVKKRSDEEEEVRNEIPLKEGSLQVNVGIPLIVICSKVRNA